MKHFTRSLYILLSIVLMLASLILPVLADGNSVQPYLQVTVCSSCNANNFRSMGPSSRTYYGTPTYCDLHSGIVGNDHQHRFTENYTLYRCFTCGYEKKFDSVYTEYCPVMNSNIGWSLR